MSIECNCNVSNFQDSGGLGSGTSSGGEGPGGPGGVNGDTLENMKSSPATAPTTPREGDNNMEFNMPNFPQGGENVGSLTKRTL